MPARLIKTEYIAIDTDGVIKADFDTEEEIKNYLNNNPQHKGYIFKTYAINNKQINTQSKIK